MRKSPPVLHVSIPLVRGRDCHTMQEKTETAHNTIFQSVDACALGHFLLLRRSGAPSRRRRSNRPFQFNVRYLTEDGRLQKVNAYPDGSASAFRNVDLRQFILSATFDL